ncbi:arylsulfatase [Cyclobacterium plantarum]|uniref:Arylsulfatase n=1 Tax=Cyclobacterium plantarum TaxID=2716263 RepID=A0ABX0HBA1_9BACT|nr:arylsulfatase [Cyclobacterium plantarum]NHE58193.1 arylsulfatase [Cyclobacterium plantarum]
MKIRHLYILSTVILLVALSYALFSNIPKENTVSANQPNVILIMLDDLGYGDIQAHGNPYLKTPHLDRLHGESVRFTNFHVDPSCTPSRAAILTGQYSSRSGVWHTIGGRSLLQKDKITMAEIFRDSGYETGYFGKWHLGENYPYRPMDRGFTETLVHGGGASAVHPDYWGNDYFDDIYKNNGVFKRYEGYSNSVWFDEASKFIRENQDKPFFAYISSNIPHAPLLVEKKYAEPYTADLSERIANYYGMVAKFDEDLGKFLKELDRVNLTENTILIFMSDNGPGPWFGGIILDDDLFVKEGYNAGMRGGKIRGYEGAHRVPFFIRWPSGGVGGGKDVDKLAAHFDILPTLIDLAGLEAPENVEFDGMSLQPLLHNPKDDWPDRTLFVHNQRLQYPVKYKDFQVLTEQWRLEGREKKELYNIKKDPGQKNDVANKHKDVVDLLTKKYEDWWQDISVDFDLYNNIIIGNERENPSLIYAHDALRNDEGLVWAIDVEKEGLYEFAIYRWPLESARRIVESEGATFRHNMPPTSTIYTNRFRIEDGERREDAQINKAHLAIGNLEKEVAVTDAMTSSTFTVQLKPGETALKAWFSGDKKYGANYVKIHYIGPAVFDNPSAYQAVHPDKWLRDK